MKEFLRNIFGHVEDGYDDEDEEDIDEEETTPPERGTARYLNVAPKREQDDAKNKVVNIHATAQLQVILKTPDVFNDVFDIAEQLKNKHTVVLNLEQTNPDVSRRVIDFLSGVAHVTEGHIKRIANDTFIITPYNVDITGNLLDELEHNGAFFG